MDGNMTCFIGKIVHAVRLVFLGETNRMITWRKAHDWGTSPNLGNDLARLNNLHEVQTLAKLDRCTSGSCFSRQLQMCLLRAALI